jgi:tungstate transport system substrate-binding protein
MFRSMRKIIFVGLTLIITALGADAQQRAVVVAATTSVEDSGLFDFLLPKFQERTGIAIRVVSRASAQALMSAERGLIDVVIVNDPAALDRFVDSGHGAGRRKIMFNDFVIAGPPSDPAHIRGMKDASAALRTIARVRASFLSRGDESGTHVAEQRLWRAAGVNPKTRSGSWYRESGLGMGLTAELAARLNAYVLTDRATWMKHTQPASLEILVEGDPLLFNQYEVIQVDPLKHPHVDVAGAKAFADWLVSDEGQDAIARYRIGNSQPFFPNAKGQN